MEEGSEQVTTHKDSFLVFCESLAVGLGFRLDTALRLYKPTQKGVNWPTRKPVRPTLD